MKQNLKEIMELGRGRHTLLNCIIANGTPKNFVETIKILRRNYDTSHYNNTYEKALKYLGGEL